MRYGEYIDRHERVARSIPRKRDRRRGGTESQRCCDGWWRASKLETGLANGGRRESHRTNQRKWVWCSVHTAYSKGNMSKQYRSLGNKELRPENFSGAQDSVIEGTTTTTTSSSSSSCATKREIGEAGWCCSGASSTHKGAECDIRVMVCRAAKDTRSKV